MTHVLPDNTVDVDKVAAEADGRFASAFIRARKPRVEEMLAGLNVVPS